jgi:hypothetical protein
MMPQEASAQAIPPSLFGVRHGMNCAPPKRDGPQRHYRNRKAAPPRRIARLERGGRLACRRNVVALGAAAEGLAIDRHCRSRLAGVGGDGARPAHRRDLQDRRTRRNDVSGQLDRGAAGQPVLPRVSVVVQNLEHGDGRRQSVHVAAGGTDDLAHRGARRCVRDLDGQEATSGASPSPISSWARSATRSSRASCCARSSCR